MISLKLPSETMGGEVIDTGNFYHFLSKDDNCDVDEENLEVEKVEKGRERNREHAKRTRLRKKAVLEGMKGKLMELQNEVSRSRPMIINFVVKFS